MRQTNPTLPKSVVDYAHDKVLISINDNPLTTLSNLQNHIHSVKSWFTK